MQSNSAPNEAGAPGARRSRLCSEVVETDIVLEEPGVNSGDVLNDYDDGEAVSVSMPLPASSPSRQSSLIMAARSVRGDGRGSVTSAADIRVGAPSDALIGSVSYRGSTHGFPIRRLGARDSMLRTAGAAASATATATATAIATATTTSAALKGKAASPHGHLAAVQAQHRQRSDAGDRLFVLFTSLFNWRIVIAICFGIATAIVRGRDSLRSSLFGEVPVFTWTSLAAALCALVWPLQILERGLWRGIDKLAIMLKPIESAISGIGAAGCLCRNLSRRWREVDEILRVCDGHLADIFLLICALLLKSLAFGFPAVSIGGDYYQRVVTLLLIIKGVTIAKNAVLVLLLRMVKRTKHEKSVHDVIFYEKILLCLSAPMPPLPTLADLTIATKESVTRSSKALLAAATDCGQQPSTDDIHREALFSSLLLDSPSFSTKASYILDNPISMFEVERLEGPVDGGQGSRLRTWQVLVEYPEELEPLARACWSRIIHRRCALERRLARLDTTVGVEDTSPLRSRLAGSLLSGFINRQPSIERRELTEEAAAPPGLVAKDTPSFLGSDAHLAPPTVPRGRAVTISDTLSQGDAALEDLDMLRKADLRCCFPDKDDLDVCWGILDMDASGEMSRDEFVNSLSLMVAAWASVATALRSYRGVSDAVGGIATGLVWIAYFLIGLAIFEINLTATLVPLLTLFVSLAFALGPLIQRMIDSLMFVFILSPFEPGDRVSIDKGPTLLVNAVGMLTTEFIDVTSGQHIIRRNSDLTSTAIANYRRSPNAAFAIPFPVDGRVSAEHMAELFAKLNEYVTMHSNKWKPPAKVMVSKKEDSNPNNGVVLTVYVTSHYSWQEGPKFGPANSDLIHFLTHIISDFDVGVEAPARAPERSPPLNHTGSSRRGLIPSPTKMSYLPPQPPPGLSLGVIKDDDDETETSPLLRR